MFPNYFNYKLEKNNYVIGNVSLKIKIKKLRKEINYII